MTFWSDLVRKERLELSRVTPLAPKASASTNSATFACQPAIITIYARNLNLSGAPRFVPFVRVGSILSINHICHCLSSHFQTPRPAKKRNHAPAGKNAAPIPAKRYKTY